jgi:hypothetical protein
MKPPHVRLPSLVPLPDSIACAGTLLIKPARLLRYLGLVIWVFAVTTLPLAAANTFSATGSLVTGRNGCTMTLLPNGKVLAAGRYDSVNVLASVE